MYHGGSKSNSQTVKHVKYQHPGSIFGDQLNHLAGDPEGKKDCSLRPVLCGHG